MTKLSKIWKRVQSRRNAHEKKWHVIVKRALNKQFTELSERIRPDNYRSDFTIEGKFLEDAFLGLYQAVGSSFARHQFRKFNSTAILHKQEDDWVNYMTYYVRSKAGKRITSINENTRSQAMKIIREELEDGVEEGLGALEMASKIKKGLIARGVDMNTWRALRIARTEIVTASNIGTLMGAKDSGYPMQKLWIPTYDSRTRDTHIGMDKQNPKGMDESFLVGGVYPAECPGDPDLPPEEVINCRCALATEMIDIFDKL